MTGDDRRHSANQTPPQIDQLWQLLNWLVPIAAGFVLLSAIAAVAFESLDMVLAGVLILGFGVIVLLARLQVRWGRWRMAVVMVCAGILVTTLAVIQVQPTWLPTLAVTPLLTVIVALPYASDRVLRYLIAVAWATTVVVAVVSQVLRPSPDLPAWAGSVFIVASLSAAVATVLLLLWQFRSRLTAMLAQTRAAEERYALAARAANDGLWDWNLDTNQVYFSPRWKTMLGCDEEEVGSSPDEWLERIHPDDRAPVESQLEAHLEGLTDTFESEYRIAHGDGGYRWMLNRGVAVTGEDGRRVRIAGFQADIDERKRAEEELGRRAAELARSNAELEHFAYSVSHDLRAPLRGINGFSQILLEDYADRLDAEANDYLRRIATASERMGQLIDAILDLSRLVRTELHQTSVDLSALARSIAEDLRKSEPERRVEFVIADKLVATGDAMLLRVLLENLLDNAWKFTRNKAHPVIEVGAAQHEGELAYYVRDNGAGFDMTYADKLFADFQRLHDITEYEGTGVGLATVARIVDRHGGRVWAEGRVGHGATFYFTL